MRGANGAHRQTGRADLDLKLMIIQFGRQIVSVRRCQHDADPAWRQPQTFAQLLLHDLVAVRGLGEPPLHGGASGFKRCAVFVGQRDEHGFRFTDMHA